MDIWSVLGIEPTDDTSIIKKAYAKKLKQYNPEEFPEEFKQLRDAYEGAVKYSKWPNKNTFIPSENSFQMYETASITEEDNESFNSTITYADSTENLNNEFIESVKYLYYDFFARIELKNWETLMNCDAIWDINNKDVISYKFLEFLSDHRYLPQNVWKLLDSNFDWTSEKSAFEYDNNIYNLDDYDDLIKYISKQLKQHDTLSYSNFKEIDCVDYEKYLTYRENAFNALKVFDINNSNLFMNNINSAKKIYQGDPELFRLEGLYYMYTNNIEKAIPLLTNFLNSNPDTEYISCYREILSYEKERLDQPNEFIKKVQTNPKRHTDRLFLVAESYFKLGALEKSKEYLLELLKFDPNNLEAKNFLSQVYAQIRKKVQKELEKRPNDPTLEKRNEQLKNEIFALTNPGSIDKNVSNTSHLKLKIIFLIIITAFIILYLLKLK